MKLDGLEKDRTVGVCGDSAPDGWVMTSISSTACAVIGTTRYRGITIKKLCSDSVQTSLLSVSLLSTQLKEVGESHENSVISEGIESPMDEKQIAQLLSVQE